MTERIIENKETLKMETMKRAAITGVKQTMLLDTPIPEPKEDWVLVKVHAVPLCTEYKGGSMDTNIRVMKR